ncbi:MAG: phenylalanine--tRNA ligase subunit beta [Candidatus Westeberhardia cardiocondylae]|nr:phenylalanine--tRNA ligase subunit beta [Candidatus Westeberhardia cardiocondylae]
MKLSEYWIREWFNTVMDSDLLLEQFSIAGMEIISVEKSASYFNNVVIGKIVMCEKHNSIDRLYITKVEVGLSNLLTILSFSSNCRINLKVAVAKIGSYLPNYGKVLGYKLHNQISEGILCSFFSLGISCNFYRNNNRIIEFPNDAPIGSDVYQYLKFGDKIINIDVATNRSDCLSIFGIARDLSVMNHKRLKNPKVNIIHPKINSKLSICVDSPSHCPLYIGRVIKNIDNTGMTPIWIQEKLRRCGFSSTDVITDISNYFLLELGQPIFIYDLKKIVSNLTVRFSELNESFVLFNDKIVSLNSETLIVSDEKKILSIAGITNSIFSKINIKTKDIFLECAYFDPVTVLRSSRTYNIRTEFSQRYEKGIDPSLALLVIERITSLLIDICGGKPGPIISVTSKKFLPVSKKIILRKKKIKQLIGFYISNNEIENILYCVGCEIFYIKIGWKVTIPIWRFDLVIEEDIIEEILRIYGYDNIPKNFANSFVSFPFVKRELSLYRIKTLLSDRGYHEIITYSFVDPKIQELIFPRKEALYLLNPISRDMSVMRLSLWIGLINSVLYNQNRQQDRIRLFESGLCFFPDANSYLGIRQDFMLAGIVTGTKFEKHWDINDEEVDFYDIKGDIESIFYLSGKSEDIYFKKYTNNTSFILHPEKSAEIYLKDKLIGLMGIIHPVLEKKLNLNKISIIFEFLWEKISEYNIPIIKNISKFPINKKDISFLVKENVFVKDIVLACKEVFCNKLVDVNLFDVYRGKGVKDGYKSLSISLIFQDNSKTLKEKEMSEMVKLCLIELKNKFNIYLRS